MGMFDLFKKPRPEVPYEPQGRARKVFYYVRVPEYSQGKQDSLVGRYTNSKKFALAQYHEYAGFTWEGRHELHPQLFECKEIKVPRTKKTDHKKNR